MKTFLSRCGLTPIQRGAVGVQYLLLYALAAALIILTLDRLFSESRTVLCNTVSSAAPFCHLKSS